MKSHASFPKPVFVVAAIFALLAVLFIPPPPFAEAGQATLSWDANAEIDLAGYKVHYGEASGSYTVHTDVGKVTTYTATGLLESKRYYFAATAYDTYGNESGYSNEVVYSVPDINLAGNGQTILNGDATPGAADHTDFGTVSLPGGTLTRTFTVQNLGTAALNLTGTPKVAVGGSHAADFAVAVLPGSPVAAGGATTFQVTFTPSATGVRTATLSIASGDPDENPYSFGIQGTGSMPAETVATPAAPSGPAGGYTQASLAYSAAGATSSSGDPVQYRFEWGDGTTSAWLASGTTSASRAWSAAGTYLVRVMARCATHTTVESAWSATLAVSITLPPEAVATPVAPTGPAGGYTQASLTYTAAGATSSYGDPVQYQFEWGDGTTSAWLASGTTSAPKAWSASGTYLVKVKARCATHTTVASSLSAALTVNITADTTPPAAPLGFKIGF